jgi:hypothetical protein
LMDALGYLFSAYHQKRRRLGPMAVLHPLRAEDVWGPWPCCTRCGRRCYLHVIKSG